MLEIFVSGTHTVFFTKSMPQPQIILLGLIGVHWLLYDYGVGLSRLCSAVNLRMEKNSYRSQFPAVLCF